MVPEDLEFISRSIRRTSLISIQPTIVSQQLKQQTWDHGRLTYEIQFKKDHSEKELIDSLRERNGNLRSGSQEARLRWQNFDPYNKVIMKL